MTEVDIVPVQFVCEIRA
ncbi:hypothetical protein BRAS3809_7780001 [Bradyrhizobium sp. STM 3809]|nr:hypothetical protein BRAS3809_7780001 [Bradyrhizobium sp. STM 3809]